MMKQRLRLDITNPSSAPSLSVVRNDASYTNCSIESAPYSSRALRSKRQRKSNSNSIFCVLTLTMILIAVALSGSAMHLTMKIHSTAEPSKHGEPDNAPASVSKGSQTQNNMRAAAAASSSSPKAKETHHIKLPRAGKAKPQQQEQQQLAYPNAPKVDAKYAKDRVYCMVPFIWNKEIYDVIMATWGKRCNAIYFITDSEVMVDGRLQGDKIQANQTKGYKHHSTFPRGTFPENVKFITMTRPWHGCKDDNTGSPKVCRHIWEKMWQSWVYVADNHLNEAEWFCKVDYDTYFFPENLQYYVRDMKKWDAYNEHHYFGLVLSHHPRKPEMIAGAAACWSHKTLEAIAEVYRKMPKGRQEKHRNKCEDRPEASEEISTSLCLYDKLNITAYPMVDDKMRQYVMINPYEKMLTWNRTEQGEWWYWQNKPKNTGQMGDCCSRRPMAIHKYKDKGKIQALDEQFYGPNNNDELKKLTKPAREYAEKVRKEMGISLS